MKISAKCYDYRKLTTNGKITSETNKPISKESIRANIGFLGMKGKLLKSLMQEKKIEREL